MWEVRMTGIDISEWQQPGLDMSPYGFVIIRASHGMTEDRHWRAHFNNAVAAGKPIGLYHYFEHNVPENEASFFHGLVGFLSAEQVAMGWWLDVEESQPWQAVDRFRAWVNLPTIGVYSTLGEYNSNLFPYLRFQLNWLAWPDYPNNPRGYAVPNYIMRQGPIVAGLDIDETFPEQPFPNAWAA